MEDKYQFFSDDDSSIEIKKDNPFKEDATKDFKGFCEKTTRILEKIGNEKSIVISLEADYGMGKSTLINMWGTFLISNGKIAIKYDAWKEDHSDEPFYSFVSSLIYQLSIQFHGNKNKIKVLKKYAEAAKALSISMFGAAKNIAGIVSSFIPHLQAIKESGKALKAIIETLDKSDKKNSPFKSAINKEKSLHDSLDAFKKHLAELASDSPIFIFVDEIDRCKPTFAIELLERIKHLFNVKNVFFIISTTTEALKQNVMGYYSYEEKTSQEYLERFFDYQFIIPILSSYNYAEYEFLRTDWATSIKSVENDGREKEFLINVLYHFKDRKQIFQEVIRLSEQHEALFYKPSYRIIRKISRDAVLFDALFNDYIPPIFYPYILMMICSYRLSRDKHQYKTNYNNFTSINVIRDADDVSQKLGEALFDMFNKNRHFDFEGDLKKRLKIVNNHFARSGYLPPIKNHSLFNKLYKQKYDHDIYAELKNRVCHVIENLDTYSKV